VCPVLHTGSEGNKRDRGTFRALVKSRKKLPDDVTYKAPCPRGTTDDMNDPAQCWAEYRAEGVRHVEVANRRWREKRGAYMARLKDDSGADSELREYLIDYAVTVQLPVMGTAAGFVESVALPARSPSAEVCPSQHFSIEKFVGQCVWHWAGIVRPAPQYRVLRCRDCCQGLIANDEARELLQISEGFPEEGCREGGDVGNV